MVIKASFLSAFSNKQKSDFRFSYFELCKCFQSCSSSFFPYLCFFLDIDFSFFLCEGVKEGAFVCAKHIIGNRQIDTHEDGTVIWGAWDSSLVSTVAVELG